MRSIDGLHPAEALDELLKYLVVKSEDETSFSTLPKLDVISDGNQRESLAIALRTRLNGLLHKLGRYGYVAELFGAQNFRLSDACLSKVHEILCYEEFTATSFDVRSAALRSFLSPELRKGLGVFLTPDVVVDQIVEFFEFGNDEVIVDPACGSGTFLLSAARNALQDGVSVQLRAIEKSARMMLLADLNLGPTPEVRFSKRVCDALRPSEYAGFVDDSSADVILTNPPFGVSVDGQSYDLSIFSTAKDDNGRARLRQSSELLFFERCLSLLRPNGTVAIVLPRSAINTSLGERACYELGRIGALRSILTLPPETFGATGTMTNTVVLFVQKFGPSLKPSDKISPAVARISNVGFDGTGRFRKGNQLPGIGRALRAAVFSNQWSDPRIEQAPRLPANETLPRLPAIVRGVMQPSIVGRSIPLGDVVSLATTGRTPPRKAYSDEGLFLVKVGNLTGSGIWWIPRARNFVDFSTGGERYVQRSKALQALDIVLTSSAHSPNYIAKKIDIVGRIPGWVGGAASFVGEVMMLRANAEFIDPFVLTAYLRLPHVVEKVQQMVRGQTAHLHPDDLLSLQLDKRVLESQLVATRLAQAVRQENELKEEMNEIAWKQIQLSKELSKEIGLGHLGS